jgi:glucose dehydrogenase
MSFEGYPPEVIRYARDWPLPHKDYGSTRTTFDSAIGLSNVASLEIAWTLPIKARGNFGAMATNPLILGDRIYLQDLECGVHCIDLASGRPVWQRPVGVSNLGPNGVAVGWDKVFAIKAPYEVAAYDMRTGADLWTRRISERETEGLDIQVLAYDGLIFVSTVPGTGHTDFYSGGVAGVLHALDQDTGKVIWKFDTADSPDIWGNPGINSGGGAWYPPSIDTETGIIYWSTGNPAPWPGTPEFPNASSRPGQNLYCDCVLAMDHRSGRLLWYNQVLPHDLFDLDMQNSVVLSEADIDGKRLQIVIAAGKMGYVYALDRQTGKTIWSTPVGRHHNDDLLELPEGITRVMPSVLGGVLTPIGCAEGQVFIPVNNLEAAFTPSGMVPESLDVMKGTGEFAALEISSGKILWQHDLDSLCLGAATIVNDLVFTSTFNGKVYAYNRRTGEHAWTTQAPGGINGWPAVNGNTVVIPVGVGENPQLVAYRLR